MTHGVPGMAFGEEHIFQSTKVDLSTLLFVTIKKVNVVSDVIFEAS